MSGHKIGPFFRGAKRFYAQLCIAPKSVVPESNRIKKTGRRRDLHLRLLFEPEFEIINFAAWKL
jgi:hypothetical protein